MRYFRILSLLAGALATVAIILCGASLAAGRAVIFAYSEEDRDTPMIQFYTAKYTEAFKRLGMTYAMAYYPKVRCSYVANAGVEVDGEPGRVHDYSAKYPNMIRIDEPSNYLQFTAYAVDPSVRLETWDDFRGDKYRVLYVSGVVFIASNLTSRVSHDHLSDVTTIEQGLRMLAAGRADVFVAPKQTASLLIKAGGADFANIREVKILDERPVYAYLHTKNADLVQPLEEVLRQINAEGTLRAFGVEAALK